jgi:hypothetical protein
MVGQVVLMCDRWEWLLLVSETILKEIVFYGDIVLLFMIAWIMEYWRHFS